MNWLYWKLRDIPSRLRFWWNDRWFKRNKKQLRNIAAWAVHHQTDGGIYDANLILKGNADRRIHEAALGRVSK